jgi:hypothetical protein
MSGTIPIRNQFVNKFAGIITEIMKIIEDKIINNDG